MNNNIFTNYQKINLKKTSNQVGLTLIITIVSEALLGFIMGLLRLSKNCNTIKGNFIYYSFLAITTLLAIFLPFIILTLTTYPNGQNNPLPFKKNSFAKIITAIVICMGATYIAQIIASILQSVTTLAPPNLPHNFATINIIAEIFAVAIIPGIVEEIVFRGIILGMFRKFGDRFAIFISALLFGLLHMNLIQFIFAFIIGLMFGFITVKLNSLLPAMVAHILNNLLSTLISLHLLNSIEYSSIMLSTTIASIVLIIVISIKDKNSLKIPNDATYPMTFGQKLYITCFSPAMLIFFILVLLTFLGEVITTCFKTIFS